MSSTHVFPPAKLSANRAIGNWLAELSKAPMQGDAYDEAMEVDATNELETLAKCVAREIEDAFATGRRVEREACAKDVPTNWLHPLLTGPEQVLGEPSEQGWGCAAIERLLRGVAAAIREGARG